MGEAVKEAADTANIHKTHSAEAASAKVASAEAAKASRTQRGAFLHPKYWLVPFCLNDTFKFAFRVALSLTLAYLIPMAMGWNQPSTAATTVMLIASTGSRRESLAKGTLRVLGTIAGGIIGLLLVGAFAQDRMLYMLSVSLAIVVIFISVPRTSTIRPCSCLPA
ncbi:hypothetical protein JCM19237_4537 [Photobacterium aphoticum]|uniref:Fusaric acid resistance domain protein n=1 Tax=Photobacterium aphoticum TaxID=754436 RepID=A0A090QW53_9GAMM|nr:hypothetical protein JCM19237_4537 [Photobacterium aphoticum]